MNNTEICNVIFCLHTKWQVWSLHEDVVDIYRIVKAVLRNTYGALCTWNSNNLRWSFKLFDRQGVYILWDTKWTTTGFHRAQAQRDIVFPFLFVNSSVCPSSCGIVSKRMHRLYGQSRRNIILVFWAPPPLQNSKEIPSAGALNTQAGQIWEEKFAICWPKSPLISEAVRDRSIVTILITNRKS